MFFADFDDQVGRRGNTAQALARWCYLVASSEVRDVLHLEMRPASYRLIRMATEITSNLCEFFVVLDSFVATNLR